MTALAPATPQTGAGPALRKAGRDRYWLLLALAGCFAGQFVFHLGGQVADGMLLYVVGALAFWRFLGRAPQPLEPLPVAAGMPAARRQPLAFALGWAAIIATCLAVLRFLTLDLAGVPVQLFVLVAAVCWVAAGAVADGALPLRRWLGWLVQHDGRYALLLLGVLALAAFVRLSRLDQLPAGVWYDEAKIGLEGWHIAQDTSFRPMYSEGTTTPAAYVYLVALAEGLLGKTVLALRLTSALTGLASTVLAFVFARLAFGPKVALAVAVLFAVARWDINFSRIAMQGPTTPLLTLLAAVAAVAAMRTGRRAFYALLGVSLGALAWFYTANLFFVPCVMVAYAATVAGPGRTLLAQRRGLVFVAVGMAMVLLPVALETATHPDLMLERPRDASVFKDLGPGGLVPTLAESIAKHLLMFNVAGDRNGRHNLPSAPMLDPITAVGMVLGLLVVLRRWRDPRSALLLAWVPLALLPAVLSVAFEAPQGLRAVGAVVPAVLLAALAMTTVTAGLGVGRSRVVTPLLLLVAGFSNVTTYFGVQADNPQVWSDFSMAPTLFARYLAQAPGGERVVGSVHYALHPTVEFLAGRTAPVAQADKMLPIRGLEPTTLFLAEQEAVTFDLARALYPGAACEPQRHPASLAPIGYQCSVGSQQLAAGRGLAVRLTPSGGGVPTILNAEAGAFDVPAADRERAVQASGSLYAPTFGAYRVLLQGPPTVRLALDGRTVVAGGGQAASVTLAEGLHALELVGEAPGEGGRIALLLQPPGGAAVAPVALDTLYRDPVRPLGLTATYRRGEGYDAPPDLQRLEPSPYIYYHVPPLPLPFTVEWTGSLLVPTTGSYGFSAETITRAEVQIDGRPLLSTSDRQLGSDATVQLSAGLHRITARHLAAGGYAHFYLRWKPPLEPGLQRIPPQNLRPW